MGRAGKGRRSLWASAFRIGLAGVLAGLIGCAAPAPYRRPAAARPAPQPTERFYAPLEDARVISPFGMRRGRLHTGVDLKRSRQGGEPVLASRAGRVTDVRSGGRYGRMVLIQHGDGYLTRYAHLRRVEVRRGQRVNARQTIGTVGATGRATTPHLHFEILTPAERPVNPIPLLSGR